MKLSIIIPVYNEEKTILPILKKVLHLTIPSVEKEIIVVDDGSTDSSKFKIQSIRQAQDKKFRGITFLSHKKNLGKGAAVRTGIKHAKGEYIVIQDADLEYNPQQLKKLIKPILSKKAHVVYGTRLSRLPDFKGEQRTPQFFLHYMGNKFLSLITSILYLQWITDMETCYKLFPKKAAKNFKLKARGFEFEPEITAKLLKRGHKIYELPIRVSPRSYREGKKLHAVRDGFKALAAIIVYRFVD